MGLDPKCGAFMDASSPDSRLAACWLLSPCLAHRFVSLFWVRGCRVGGGVRVEGTECAVEGLRRMVEGSR